MTSPAPKRSCTVCRSPFRLEFEAMREAGFSFRNIEARSRELGAPAKWETIQRHHEVCLGIPTTRLGIPTARHSFKSTTPESTAVPMKPEAIAVIAAAGPPTGSRDFATLVHARAVELFAGTDAPKVSVRDGLAARQILDRREEKAEDRKFMVNLARLLSGGGAMAPVALIEEGEYKDVTPAEELAASSLLAPPHLREARE